MTERPGLLGVNVDSDQLVLFDFFNNPPAIAELGAVGFDEVRGLALNLATGELFGSDVATNQIIQIDPNNGTGAALGGPIGFTNVQGLGIDPFNGIMYGVADDPGGDGQVLIDINMTTGVGTLIGPVQHYDSIH